LAAWLACLAASACDQTPSTELVYPPPTDASDVSTTDAADEVLDDGGMEATEAHESTSTEPAPVIVGLAPTAHSVLDGGTQNSGELDAVLLSFASGARVLTAQVSWADLLGMQSAETWQRLHSLGSLVQTQKKTLLVSLLTVDGVTDKRPSALKTIAWDHPTTIASMHSLLDTLLENLGTELRYLSLGNEVDRYVAAQPGQAAAFLAFAADAISYANTRAKVLPAHESLQTTVTWSHSSWTTGALPSPSAAPLLAASEVVMVSYAPMDDQLHAASSDVAHGDLPAMLKAIDGKPLVLASVSYPSSSLIGATEDAQAHFIDLLLLEVTAHRASVPFVAVNALHDPEPEACLARAASMGHEGSAELYAWWCSTGLRTRDGEPKKAFDTFRSGTALLLEP
jgi:hypothetical protein